MDSKIGVKLRQAEAKRQRKERRQLEPKCQASVREGILELKKELKEEELKRSSSRPSKTARNNVKRLWVLKAPKPVRPDTRPARGFIDATVTRDGFPVAQPHRTRRSPRRGLAKFGLSL